MLEKIKSELLNGEITNLSDVDDKMVKLGFYSEMIDSQDRENIINSLLNNYIFDYTTRGAEIRYRFEVNNLDKDSLDFIIIDVKEISYK